MDGNNNHEAKRKMRLDKELNQLKIKESFLALIAELSRRPTVDEVCQRSGLSDKVVRNALKTIRFEAVKSPMRLLTDDVILKLYQRATGYEHKAVKFMTVSIGMGCGSQVEEKEYTEHYPPDAAAAKLWLQVVEGWTEKQEVKQKVEHSGQVTINTPPVTLKIQRGGKVSNEGTEAE